MCAACVNLFYIMPSDDRPVRDSERKAALMHFDSSQVSESTERNIHLVLLIFHTQAAELRHQEITSQVRNGEQEDNVPKQ